MNILQATQYSFGLNDAWILDSGASCHIANQERYLSNYIPIENIIQGIGGKASISGIGELTLKVGTEIPKVKKSTKEVILKGDTWTQITLNNAACVKESPVNLISISAWTDQFPHHEMITMGDEIKMLDNNKFLALGQKLGERKSGNCWYLVATVDLAQHTFLTRTIQDWHMILGHTDPNNIRRLASIIHKGNKKAMIKLPAKETPKYDQHSCTGCLQGKSTVRPFLKNKGDWGPERGPCDLIVSDVWGPAQTTPIFWKQAFHILHRHRFPI
ncbi:integrase core domain protein [Ceratobasidium sp. AG-Ba]|nr:integrase core domain protein [Ceratobasidium sp. AG-Ba]